MISVQDLILNKANRKLNDRTPAAERLRNLTRIIQLDTGGDRITFILDHGLLSLAGGELKPDIVLIISEGDIRSILEKSLDPMEAYSQGRLKVKSSLMDKLLMAEMLS
ncbi:MAG: SCP2 sterol-binding domain-containing protein [Aquificaceae bacterium]|nr:SCP2 sterol-binding domain-containing protein [Aquificaceae bacterium]